MSKTERLLNIARALHSLSVKWHESEIAKHRYKIAKADARLLKRIERHARTSGGSEAVDPRSHAKLTPKDGEGNKK